MNQLFSCLPGFLIYAIKQVAPVIMEKANEIVVITVYTFYF